VVAGQIPITFRHRRAPRCSSSATGGSRRLAVSNPTRIAERRRADNAELRLSAINSGAWVAVLATLGTPPGFIARLNRRPKTL